MRYVMLILMLIIATPYVVAATTVPSAPVLRSSLINQDPDPVEPGNYVELRWLVVNGGYSDAKDVTFEILPEYPFSIPNGESALRTFPIITANPDSDEYVIVYYKLRVDDQAVEGTEQIKLRYRIEDGQWRFAQDTYDVRVKTYDTYLSVDSITSMPEIIEPGQTSKVNFKLENVGDTTITDAKVNLGLDDSTLPLSPVGSSNEKIITSVKPNEIVDVDFAIAADAEADSGVYKVPLTLTYMDVNGDNYSTEKIFSLIVGADPEITAVLEETDIKSGGQKGTITTKFINKGVTDIKFLDINLKDSPDYDVLSVSEVYIGNVDSDDYETADFDIFVKNGAGASVDIPVTYQYRDSNNKQYVKDDVLKLKLYSEDELEKYGYANGNNKTAWIIVAVVALLVFFIWRRRKKNKKSK